MSIGYNLRKWLLSCLYPNRCLFCDHVIVWNRFCCEACADSIPYALDVCPLCGKAICVCGKGFAYDSCAVVCHYRDSASEAVKRMKFHDRPDLAENAGAMLFERVKTLRVDAVLAVPMEASALRKRGYNQAELLAREIARAKGLPLLKRCLVKIRKTEQQHTLSAEERAANLAGAFDIARADAVRGKTILLCDDVLTTGHTLHACALALKKAGAIRVECAVFATVPEKSREKA